MDFHEFLREQLGHEPTEWQREVLGRLARGERFHLVTPRSIEKRHFLRALAEWHERFGHTVEVYGPDEGRRLLGGQSDSDPV